MTNTKQQSISRVRLAAAGATLTVVVFLLVVAATRSAQAQIFTVLHYFGGAGDGSYPYAGAVRDEVGNLYGTTWEGGDTEYDYVLRMRTRDSA